MKFSIIVVALNPGGKLKQTVDSVLSQTYSDYEIVVKDGGSKDGSVEKLPKDERIRLFTQPDKGIYDAMNQAVAKAQGDYLLFLNCGDLFYDEKVLERTADRIEKEQGDAPLVLYGDTYGAKNNVLIASSAKIDGFACFRNIPCHQSCFYAARLCREKPFCEEYRIRADYDHFLWCFYRAGAKMVYLGNTISSYEGGGYSESGENRRRDREEHRQITEEYMTPEELAAYRRTMLLTLAPVRSFLAENRLTSGIYHWIKDRVYRHKLRILVGLVLLAVELALYFGSDILLEEKVNYLTGEGSWEETQGDGANSFTQAFIPENKRLISLGFLMNMEGVEQRDGEVTVLVSDENNRILFKQNRSFDKISDGQFTNVKMDLELSTSDTYFLTIVTTPSSTGAYPTVGVCGMSYYLPENQTLTHADEMPDAQLVSRYQYRMLPFSKALKVIFICLLTALGVMFGLPDNKWLRRAVSIFLLAAVPYVLGSRLEMLVYNETLYLPISMKWNVGIMYGLELLVLLVTHSPGIAIVLTNIALTLLYSANYFVNIYRGTPLRTNDFTAIRTAAKVVGEYSFVPNGHLAIVWGLLVLFVVFGVQTGIRRAERKRLPHEGRGKGYWAKKLGVYAVTTAMAAAAVRFGSYQLFETDLLDRAGFEYISLRGFNQDAIFYFNGYLIGTCIEIKESHILPPEGYSIDRVEEILRENADGGQVATEELPHVILIMNESFSDLRILGDLGLNQENMGFFYSLEENTMHGYVNASVFGGGTANSEFEVLTGCSMAFFPASYYPYHQCIKRPLNSLVSSMLANGYTAYSMHPKDSDNWNRNNVYKYFGFQECLWEEDFAGAEEIHMGVSDAETYNKIIELYENRQEGEKLFVFDVTMQNHGGYLGEEAPYEVQSEKFQDASIDQFLTLMKISDEAFAGLVEYFEGQDERVIICMFGDHQPHVSNQILGTDDNNSNLDADKLMKKYKAPFVIWANYDIEEADDYDIGMNYLGVVLLRTAGIPMSPYFTFLEKLCVDYPIITLNGYVDSEGNYSSWSDTSNEFSEYRMLQYNYIFDDERVEWGY